MFFFLQISHELLSFYKNRQKEHANSCFPSFLRLPLLAREEVLNNLSPLELIDFSLMSKRAKTIVMNCKAWKNVEVRMVFHPKHFAFSFSSESSINIFVFPESYWSYQMSGSRIFSGNKATIGQGDGFLSTYWKDAVNGIESIGDYILGMFSKPPISFYICQNALPYIKNVVDWLKKQNITELNSLTAEGYAKSDEEIYLILNNFKIRRSLSSHVKLDFSKLQNALPTNLDDLYLSEGQNITLNHIFTMNSTNYFLTNAMLISENLNNIMRSWMKGDELTRLKYFRLHSLRKFKWQEVIKDIEGVMRDPSFERSYFFYHDEKSSISGGFDIKRKDGITATISMNHFYFRMVVWPDANGNLII